MTSLEWDPSTLGMGPTVSVFGSAVLAARTGTLKGPKDWQEEGMGEHSEYGKSGLQ